MFEIEIVEIIVGEFIFPYDMRESLFSFCPFMALHPHFSKLCVDSP